MSSTTIHQVLKNAIQQFSPIGLEQLNGVRLMDRVDTKYLIPIQLLPEILGKIAQNYSILEINQERICPYSTLYYDTDDLLLYQKHHAGALNRYKIRWRTYLNSDTHFLEIKHKNNKGRTIKTRIEQEETAKTFFNDANAQFLIENSPINPQNIKGKLWVDYSRMTFVNQDKTERLTIDINLTFKNTSEQTLDYPEIAILELKQSKSSHSPIKEIIARYGIKEGAISKYCLGIISVFNDVKHNHFKLFLKNIQKIQQLGFDFAHPSF